MRMWWSFVFYGRSMEIIWKSKPYLKCIIGPSIFIHIAQVLLLFLVDIDSSLLLNFLPPWLTFLSPPFPHIEPINIFHGSYNTDTPPIRLSYHHGNHYNSLVDPRRLAIGAGLGFSCLRGVCSICFLHV